MPQVHVNAFVVMCAVSTLPVPAVGHIVRCVSSHTVLEFSRSNQFGIDRRSEGVAIFGDFHTGYVTSNYTLCYLLVLRIEPVIFLVLI